MNIFTTSHPPNYYCCTFNARIYVINSDITFNYILVHCVVFFFTFSMYYITVSSQRHMVSTECLTLSIKFFSGRQNAGNDHRPTQIQCFILPLSSDLYFHFNFAYVCECTSELNFFCLVPVFNKYFRLACEPLNSSSQEQKLLDFSSQTKASRFLTPQTKQNFIKSQ